MRPRVRLAVLSVLTAGVAATVAQVGPASAQTSGQVRRVAVDQGYPVPSSGRYTVNGHGYGHGHGMSQYGAQGAALQGLTHQEILDFYYPGTELGTARRKVKVLITADTSPSLIVEARSGLHLVDRGDGSRHELPRDLGATRWRLGVGGDNLTVVDYMVRGRWRRWEPDGRPALAGDGQFRASGPLSLVLPSGATATYRGALRAVSPSAGSAERDTVNVLGLDSYVRGVVPSEMPASWKPEAVQAQAVAARTYAAFERAEDPHDYYDTCDTTSCQVYRGVDGEHPLGDDAVRATRGEILRYDGEPAFTQFSSSSGGWTSQGSRSYLAARKDPYDGWSGNGNHAWSVTLRAATIEGAYPALGSMRAIRVTSRDGNGQWDGRVLRVVLVGSKKDVSLTGDDFRYRFGLKSTWFSF
jgi:stage II sporulation protein D